MIFCGRVAQRIRRPTSNRKIVGSSPIVVKYFQFSQSVTWLNNHTNFSFCNYRKFYKSKGVIQSVVVKNKTRRNFSITNQRVEGSSPIVVKKSFSFFLFVNVLRLSQTHFLVLIKISSKIREWLKGDGDNGEY